MNTLLSNDFGLVHFFHGIDFLIFFAFDTPNLPKSSLADYILTIEMLTIYLFVVKIDVILDIIFSLQFRKIDFKAIFDVLI